MADNINKVKTRALRKYEAAPEPIGVDGGEPAMDLFSPFGPMIARSRAPQALIDRINAYADHRLAGSIGAELHLPDAEIHGGGETSLAGLVDNMIRRYLARMDEAADCRIRLDIAWIVSQPAGSPSPVHFHSGQISGVLYLKTPDIEREAEEERKTYISGRRAGYINFLIGGKQQFSKSLVSFKPRVGDFYIFPGWLLHGAEPFRGSGERRSMAFNAFVDFDDN